MNFCKRFLIIAVGFFTVPHIASADWVPLITSGAFTGPITDVMTVATSIITIGIILFALGLILSKL